MSVAMLSSLSVNFTVFNASVPPASSADRPARPVEQEDDDRPRFRENTLVNAMMAAFQALGIGQAAATTTGSSAPAASGTSSVAANDSTANTSGTASTASTASTSGTASTATTAAPDTLEKAVNEFAHALSVMLHRHGRGEHEEGQHDGEHGHGHEGRGNGGYNGFAQRLEQLAQSLGGTATVSPASAPAASGATASSPSDQTATVPASTTSTTAPSTQPVSTLPNRSLTRLLAAFTNVLNFLQPPTTAATTAPATTPATGSSAATAASVTDKLRLFLTTLAQSLNTGAQLSPIGSRVNLSV